MKAKSKVLISFILAAIMLLSLTVYSAEHVVDTPTPKIGTLKWATKIGEGWQKSAGIPLLVNNNIVITSGDELCLVDKNNGDIINRIEMAQSHSYGYVPPTFAENKIFMPLSSGTVQAFDAKTLEPLWTYRDNLGGKAMSNIVYSENTVFTGFWNSETATAAFVALNSSDGTLKWSKTIDGGVYWSGAYCDNTAVIFGTDDGSDGIAHIYSCNKKNGEIISEIRVENKGDIRSSVTYDNGKIFLTTKGGYLISADYENGILSNVLYGEIGAASTSTPVVYKNRVYIGMADKTISVFDALTLEKILAVVDMPAYPQCTPLISTFYEEQEGYLYLYATYNKTPGGIILIKIKPDAEDADDYSVTELFDAEGYEQYCISDIISDENGTIYYKNDSGYLFAIGYPSVTVSASISNDGYIMPVSDICVTSNFAENYGYYDQVDKNEVSALDVLVASHKKLFGDDFTAETANNHLSVSEEGYLSRVVGIDTYNFGFAINGKAPHDDILTNYGYTGYSLNQAVVKNADKVEFFIYRDSWAMDNYVNFKIDNTDVNSVSVSVGEKINLHLKGYTFGWYSCYDETTIQSMMSDIKNANIMLLNEDGTPNQIVATTDNLGKAEITFSSPGKFILTAKENEGEYPIIPSWLEVNVVGVTIEINDKKLEIKSNLDNKTDATLIIAEYENNMLIKSDTKPITLPKGYYEDIIDVSSYNGEIKAFIWKKNLSPLTEVD